MKKKTSLLLGLLTLFVVSAAQVQARPCGSPKMQPMPHVGYHQQFDRGYHRHMPPNPPHRMMHQQRPSLLGAHVNVGSFFIGFNF